MALSNIFCEPRREITETLVGALPVAGFLFGDYRFSRWLEVAAPKDQFPWEIGMLIGLLGAMAILLGLFLFSIGTHALGEGICNSLQRRGIHLRPKQRR